MGRFSATRQVKGKPEWGKDGWWVGLVDLHPTGAMLAMPQARVVGGWPKGKGGIVG